MFFKKLMYYQKELCFSDWLKAKHFKRVVNLRWIRSWILIGVKACGAFRLSAVVHVGYFYWHDAIILIQEIYKFLELEYPFVMNVFKKRYYTEINPIQQLNCSTSKKSLSFEFSSKCVWKAQVNKKKIYLRVYLSTLC